MNSDGVASSGERFSFKLDNRPKKKVSVSKLTKNEHFDIILKYTWMNKNINFKKFEVDKAYFLEKHQTPL